MRPPPSARKRCLSTLSYLPNPQERVAAVTSSKAVQVELHLLSKLMDFYMVSMACHSALMFFPTPQERVAAAMASEAVQKELAQRLERERTQLEKQVWRCGCKRGDMMRHIP